MSWLSIVLYIIFNLPKLLGIIKQLIDLIHGLPKEQGAALKSQLEDAIAYHKETGDDSKIKNICVGVGCSPEPVSEIGG